MAPDHAFEDIGEIGEGLDAVEAGGLEEAGEDGPGLGAAVGAGEEIILAPERDGSDLALNRVGVELDTAIVGEAGQAVPARQRVADGAGERALAREAGELALQPGTQVVENRPALLGPGLAAVFGGPPPDLLLHRVERGDAEKRLGGDGRARGRLDVVELAPRMRLRTAVTN